MISIGRTDLVRSRPVREKKAKDSVQKQQELGCSDGPADSTLQTSNKDYIVQSIDKHTSTSPDMSNTNKENIVPQSLSVTSESNRQSTGDTNSPVKASIQDDQPKQSKNIFSSIKNFFNR